MHLSEMNRLHGVDTIITFRQAGIKSYLPPKQVQNLGGQAAVKSSFPHGQVLKKFLCQPVQKPTFSEL